MLVAKSIYAILLLILSGNTIGGSLNSPIRNISHKLKKTTHGEDCGILILQVSVAVVSMISLKAETKQALP
jgi:hypothetical protein